MAVGGCRGDNTTAQTTERTGSGIEIVTNSKAKSPAWNYFGFPGNGHGTARTKTKVASYKVYTAGN